MKDVVGSKHKGGRFILRWWGDRISLFLEVAFVEDLEPKRRRKVYKLISEETEKHRICKLDFKRHSTQFQDLDNNESDV